MGCIEGIGKIVGKYIRGMRALRAFVKFVGNDFKGMRVHWGCIILSIHCNLLPATCTIRYTLGVFWAGNLHRPHVALPAAFTGLWMERKAYKRCMQYISHFYHSMSYGLGVLICTV